MNILIVSLLVFGLFSPVTPLSLHPVTPGLEAPAAGIISAPLLQEGEPTAPVLPDTFRDLVNWLGSAAFIGGLLSFLLREWAWFIGLGSGIKWLITFLISVGLPVIAKLLELFLPAEAWAFLETWYPVVASGLIVWLGSQVWYNSFVSSLPRKISVFTPPAKEGEDTNHPPF